MSQTQKLKDELEKKRTEIKKEIRDHEIEFDKHGIKSKMYGPSVMRVVGYKMEVSSKTLRVARKNKTLKSSKEAEQKLKLQTNSSQLNDGNVLFQLLENLDLKKHCKGVNVLTDIVQHKNEPYRHIFVFLSTSKKVAGFISGTKIKNQNSAIIDYICPNTKSDAVWQKSKMLNQFIGYAILNMMWLNNKHNKRYSKIMYNGRAYTCLRDVDHLFS